MSLIVFITCLMYIYAEQLAELLTLVNSLWTKHEQTMNSWIFIN